MTETMRERKINYVEKAIDYLDCECFCLSRRNAVAEICSELGIEIPSGKKIEFRYYLYGAQVEPNRRMMLRVDYKDTFHPLADTMIEEAFFHYAQRVPEYILEEALKAETENRIEDIFSRAHRCKKENQLDAF
jgi:hypothetical protein